MEQTKEKKKFEMIIEPLGSGQEVGRSCILLKFQGKTIMFDCGLHQGKSGKESLPYLDKQKLEEIDLVLITHFHTDHCAALPYLVTKTNFQKGNGKIYMTAPTRAIFKPFTQDSLKVKSEYEELYDKSDIDTTYRKINVINFDQELEYNGIKVKCYCAGHVLGAAMFQVEIDGVKVLYTGDYSTEKERLMQPAQIPNEHIDVLIVESTFGKKRHIPRMEREQKFKDMIYRIVSHTDKNNNKKEQGKVLLPVTTSGRAEEILLILEELWEECPELHEIPIQFQSKKFNDFKEIFQQYLEFVPREIRNKTINPFNFKYATVTKQIVDVAHTDKPCVVLASPGQMNHGSYSKDIFLKWCHDSKNLCLLTGFCQEGSFARSLTRDKHQKIDGKEIKIQIDELSFCAHADFDQTKNFVDSIKPEYVVLVHGQEKNARDLQYELLKLFKGKIKEVKAPKNQQQEKFYFQKKQSCQIIGSLEKNIQQEIDLFKSYIQEKYKDSIQKKMETEQTVDNGDENENEKQENQQNESVNQNLISNNNIEEEKEQEGKIQDQQKNITEGEKNEIVQPNHDVDITEQQYQQIQQGQQLDQQQQQGDIQQQQNEIQQQDDMQQQQEQQQALIKTQQVIQKIIKVDGLLYQNENKQMFFMGTNDKFDKIPIQRVQVKEKVMIQFQGNLSLLEFFAKQIINPMARIQYINGIETLIINKLISIEKIKSDMVSISWVSGTKTDEIVDNFSLLIMELQKTQVEIDKFQENEKSDKENQNNYQHLFQFLLKEYPLSRFEQNNEFLVISSEEQRDIATINLKGGKEIITNDLKLRSKLQNIMEMLN